MTKISLLSLFFLIPPSVHATEVCGSTVQTFWQLDINKKSLVLKAKYRHAQSDYCERSMTASPNAEVTLLDDAKNPIRKFGTFLATQFYVDRRRHRSSQGLYGGVKSLTSPVVQIKFANDEGFKKAKYILIRFNDGSSYGPSEL